MNESELTTKIRELDAAMEEVDTTIQDRQREIGERLLDAQWEQNPSSRVQNHLTNAQRLRHELDDLKITRNRLDEAQRRKGEIEKEKKELNRRITKSMSNVEPHFEEIGRLAFDVYRTNPVVDSSAEEIFGPLLNKFNEIKTADRDVARLADERKRGRNPMGQLVSGGRLLYERGKLQLRKTNISGLYTSAGRQVCTSGLIDRLDDPRLEQAAAHYFEARRHMETAEAKQQELAKEEENLELERMTLLDGKGVNERRAELMTMLRKREHGLEEALRDLGRSYVVAKSRPHVEPEVGHLVDQLQEFYEQRKEYERKRKRVDAALRILDIDTERDAKESSIEKLRQEREQIDRRIEEIQEELSQEEERRKRLMKARGKTDDLLE